MKIRDPFKFFHGWHVAHDFGGKGRPKTQAQIIRQSLRVENSEQPPVRGLDPGRSVTFNLAQREVNQPNANPGDGFSGYNPVRRGSLTNWPYRLA